jgi:hypothetical protein
LPRQMLGLVDRFHGVDEAGGGGHVGLRLEPDGALDIGGGYGVHVPFAN